MDRSFFPGEGRWLKGNTHSHTTRTDGTCPPEQQIRDYMAKGYDFLAITDHNVIDSHQLGAGLDICMIPGWERDIRHRADNAACIHVVGLLPRDAAEVPPLEVRRYEVNEVPDQQLLDEMRAAGQFVILAHPRWSRMTLEDMLNLTGYDAVEVFNTGCERLMHAGSAGIYWDTLLEHGRPMLGVACDDTHEKTPNRSDRFGGWVMVRSTARTPAAIISAMRAGGFYSTQGPVIEDWGIRNGEIYLKCSPCKEVHVVAYPVRGRSFWAPEDGYLTEVSYPLKGGERYIRVECRNEAGETAWTNPHFFDAEDEVSG